MVQVAGEDLVHMVAALYAVSPSGGGSTQHSLAMKYSSKLPAVLGGEVFHLQCRYSGEIVHDFLTFHRESDDMNLVNAAQLLDIENSRDTSKLDN